MYVTTMHSVACLQPRNAEGSGESDIISFDTSAQHECGSGSCEFG